MAPVEGRFGEDLETQFQRYRLELRGHFYRSLIGYLAALLLLFLVTSESAWALCIAAIWSVMLCMEAKTTFGNSENSESGRFQRWRHRQLWIAAGLGDSKSLQGLQNLER